MERVLHVASGVAAIQNSLAASPHRLVLGDKVLFCTSPWCRLGTCSSSEGQSQAGRQPRRLEAPSTPPFFRFVFSQHQPQHPLKWNQSINQSINQPAPSRRNLPRSNGMGRPDGLPIDTQKRMAPRLSTTSATWCAVSGMTRAHLRRVLTADSDFNKTLVRHGDRLIDNTTKLVFAEVTLRIYGSHDVWDRRYD